MTYRDIYEFKRRLPDNFSGGELGLGIEPKWLGWIITTGSTFTDEETGEARVIDPVLMNRIVVQRGDKWYHAPTSISLYEVERTIERSLDPKELGLAKMEGAWLALRDVLQREAA